MKRILKITEYQIITQKKKHNIFHKHHMNQEILEIIFFMKLTLFKFITYIIKAKIQIQIEQLAYLKKKIKNL